MDPREQRAIRLTNEYTELMRLNGPAIQIEPLGSAPYTSYRITYRLRTFIGCEPIRYRDVTVCKLTLPNDYPTAPPILMCETMPAPWHVNWWQNGRWCYGRYTSSEPLTSYVLRAARTLQNDPALVNVGSPANSSAIPFWESIKNNKRLVPCDRTPLPTAELPAIEIRERPPVSGVITIREKALSGKITIKASDKPRITIRNRSSEE